jgi:lipopolysaccharide biosynthesis protein
VRWRGLRLWPRAGAVGERHAWLAPQQAPEPQPAAGPAKAPVAVCLHLYYLSLWPMLWRQLQHIPQPWDLYLSVPAFAASAQLARIAQDHPRTTFWPLPNRGRDVAPLLRWLQDGAFDGHDLVCKLHGKHSPHRADGAAWRDSLLDGLLGSTERVAAIVERFRQDPQLGLLAPAGALQRPTAAPGWAKNARGVAQLARRLGLDEIPADTLFAAGTMFWFRPQALQRLRCLGSDPALFPPEMHQTDGTPAHALERLMGACAQADGFTVAAWPPPALTGPG